MKQDVCRRICDAKIVAIVRAKSAASLGSIAEALHAGGIGAIEATLTTPGAIDSVRSLPAEWHDRMVVGVGTVLDTDSASAAIDAGARFIVTPVLRPEVVRVCNQRGIAVVCGALTPTEALAAHECGADFVKIFPAADPAYIRSILAPLPFLRIIPTGGISPQSCRAFLGAGCVALGAGSRLVSDDILEREDWPTLTARAREFMAAVQ